MGSIQVMNETGDETAIDWDPADDGQVAEAEKKWKELEDQGYEMFEAAETKGKRITKFKRELGRVLASPGVQSAGDKAAGRRGRASRGGPNNRSA